jgi:signal transduction histidine kinase
VQLFWNRLELQRRLLEAERTSARNRVQRYFALLHTTKGRWQDVVSLLERGGSVSTSQATAIARSALEELSGSQIVDSRSQETTDTSEAIRQVLRSRHIQFRNARIRARSELADIPPIRLPIIEFNEVLNNLLSNSVRAVKRAKRERGEIVIRTALEKSSQRVELVISVQDNGVGIPKDRLDLIFQRDFTTHRNEGGTGLGLFIARDIIANYGGNIRAESRLGEGSTFTIRIPWSWIGV